MKIVLKNEEFKLNQNIKNNEKTNSKGSLK